MANEQDRRKVQEMIEKINLEVETGSGWYAVAVTEDHEEKTLPFIYSVGLTSAGLPELIISGRVSPEVGQEILRLIIERIKNGEISYETVPRSGFCLGGVLEGGYDLFLRRVTGVSQHERLLMALEFQRARGEDPADVLSLQIVLPDQENRFPWEVDYSGAPEQEQLWE